MCHSQIYACGTQIYILGNSQLYSVDFNSQIVSRHFERTFNSIKQACKYTCYQCIWLEGH